MKKHTISLQLIQRFLSENELQAILQEFNHIETARKCKAFVLLSYLIHALPTNGKVCDTQRMCRCEYWTDFRRSFFSSVVILSLDFIAFNVKPPTAGINGHNRIFLTCYVESISKK